MNMNFKMIKMIFLSVFVLLNQQIGCKFFLQNQTELNFQLYDAVKASDITKVQKLIKAGADVNMYHLDVNGNKQKSPLFDVVINNTYHATFFNQSKDLKLMQLLIDAGMDLGRCKPLHAAAKMQNISLLEMFIKNNVDINSIDIWQWSALDHALYYQYDEKIITWLIEHGAIINRPYKTGPLYSICGNYSPLIYSVSRYCCTPKGLDTVIFLVKHGVDVNQQDTVYGWTALHWAIYQARKIKYELFRNQYNIVKFLINSGADINIRDIKGYTPLDYAKTYGLVDFVNLLSA